MSNIPKELQSSVKVLQETYLNRFDNLSDIQYVPTQAFGLVYHTKGFVFYNDILEILPPHELRGALAFVSELEKNADEYRMPDGYNQFRWKMAVQTKIAQDLPRGIVLPSDPVYARYQLFPNDTLETIYTKYESLVAGESLVKDESWFFTPEISTTQWFGRIFKKLFK